MNSLTKLIIRAVLFALAVNAVAIVALSRFPNGYSDSLAVDERVYIKLALDRGYFSNHPGPPNRYGVPASHTDYSQSPNILLDTTVGSLANVVDAKPQTLSVFFDLVSCFFCYLFATFFFRDLTRSGPWSEIGACLFIIYPHAFVLNATGGLRELFSFLPVEYEVGGNPVLRGVATQLSLIVFLLSASLVSSAFNTIGSPVARLVLAGLSCGLLSSMYPFTWITGIGYLTALLAAFLVMKFGSLPGPIRWRYLVIFVASWGAASIPGIVAVAFSTETLVEIDRYYFWSWTVGAEFFALLIVTWISWKKNQVAALLSSSAVICLFLELALPNIQPLIGRAIQPFHFATLVVHPILSTTMFLLALHLLFFKVPYEKVLRLRNLAATAVSCSFLIVTSVNILHLPKLDAVSELLAKLDSLPDDAVIAVLTDIAPFRTAIGDGFSFRSMPNLLYSLSGKRVLHQNWFTLGMTAEADAEREVLLGWIFSGHPQAILPCEDNVEQPGDIFSGTWTAYLLQRRMLCTKIRSLANEDALCTLLRKYRIDFVLREEILSRLYPAAIDARFFTSIWRSPTDPQFQLLSFDQRRARDTFCGNLRTNG